MYKNPQHEGITKRQNKYSIRKMTAGIASVMVGSMLLFAPQASAQEISEDEALSIAMDAAGVDSIGAMDDFELDTDDGRQYYEFEFVTDGVEYDFEIDANTGEVLDLDIDGVDAPTGGTGTQDDSTADTGTQDDGAAETGTQDESTADTSTQDDGTADISTQDDDYYDDDNGEVEYTGDHDYKKDYVKKDKVNTLGYYKAYVHGTFGKDDFVAKGETVPHGYVKVMLPNGEVYETNADKHGDFKLGLSELKAWDDVSVYFADKHGNDAKFDFKVKPFDKKDKDKYDKKDD